jgi:hypothetical protein
MSKLEMWKTPENDKINSSKCSEVIGYKINLQGVFAPIS